MPKLAQLAIVIAKMSAGLLGVWKTYSQPQLFIDYRIFLNMKSFDFNVLCVYRASVGWWGSQRASRTNPLELWKLF
jgi:hypothetical protein